LATRFHWTLEERTQVRYGAAREGNYIENISDRALSHEIQQLAQEDNPIEALKALEKEDWLKILVPHLSLAKVDAPGLTHMFKVKQQIQDLGLNPDPSPIAMHFLTRKLGEKEVSSIQRQLTNKGFVERWRNLEDDAKDFAKRLIAKDLALPSASWKFLMQSRPETVLYAAITPRASAVEQKLKNFLTKWPLLRQKLPFPEMPELRITPEHPEYKKILDQAFLLLLDGRLRSHNEIVKFLTPFSPPEPPPPPPPPRRVRGAKKEAAAAAPGAGMAAGSKKRGRKPKTALAGPPPGAAASPGVQPPVAGTVPSGKAAVTTAKPTPAVTPAQKSVAADKGKAGERKPAATIKVKATPKKQAPKKAAHKPTKKQKQKKKK
jgi:hypothetical protein